MIASAKSGIAATLSFFLLASFSLGQIERPNLDSASFRQKLEDSYEAVSTAEPPVTEIEGALLEQIRSMIQSSPAQARNMLVDILSDGTPVSAAFNHSLGNIYYSAGEYLNAEIQFAAAIEKLGTFQRAWNGLGLTRFRQDDFEGALGALAKSIELGANDAETYGILGYCHLRLGNLKSAEVAYDLAILKDPGNEEWTEGLGQIYMDTERYDEARRVFAQLAREYPGEAKFWLAQANTWLASEEPLKTARCLEIANRIDRLDSSAMLLLADIYLNEGIYDRAEKIYLDSLQRSSDVDEERSLQALRYLTSRGQFDIARKLIAGLGEPDDDWSRESKASYYFINGALADEASQYGTAETSYQLVLEQDPFNGQALMRLAQLYIDTGRPENAEYLLERLEMDESLAFTSLVLRSQLLIDSERYADALPLLERAMRIEPSDALRSLYSQIRLAAESPSSGG